MNEENEAEALNDAAVAAKFVTLVVGARGHSYMHGSLSSSATSASIFVDVVVSVMMLTR